MFQIFTTALTNGKGIAKTALSVSSILSSESPILNLSNFSPFGLHLRTRVSFSHLTVFGVPLGPLFTGMSSRVVSPVGVSIATEIVWHAYVVYVANR